MKIELTINMESNVTDPYVDTDVIIRLLTKDDIKKQKAAASLFEKVAHGTLTLLAPVTVIVDAVYVLSSSRLYNLPRSEIRDLLSTLVTLPGFRVESKQVVLKALNIYASGNLDFGDVFLICCVKQTKAKRIYSYDHDFDHIQGIVRKEP